MRAVLLRPTMIAILAHCDNLPVGPGGGQSLGAAGPTRPGPGARAAGGPSPSGDAAAATVNLSV